MKGEQEMYLKGKQASKQHLLFVLPENKVYFHGNGNSQTQ